jgi:hypothetical protein
MMRPAPRPVPFNNPYRPAFVNGATFVNSGPTVTRTAPGFFNRATGAFAPSPIGNSALSTRFGFQPVQGKFTPSPSGDFVLRQRASFDPVTKTFTPSPTGAFISRERGAFTPATGSFVTSTSGAFNLASGAFLPGKGAFTLSTNSAFVPTRGTFVPSLTGNFVLSAREAFRPATGTFVTSANGPFTFQVRGDFVPTTKAAAALGMPLTVSGGTGLLNTPLSNAAAQLASLYNTSPANALLALQQGLSPSPMYNPYLAAAYGSFGNPYVNPYAYSNPYQSGYGAPATNSYGYANPYTPSSNGYGASYGSSQGYGASYGSSQNNQPNIPAYTSPGAVQPTQEPLLAALGVPNTDGSVQWPLALRVMPPQKKKELLDPLEAQLQIIAQQSAAGKANPTTVREARDSVDRLFGYLRSHRLDIAEGSFKEARRFLERIDASLDSMKSAY